MIEEWKEKAEHLKYDDGKSWSQVYEELAPYFPELTKKQIEEKVRSYLRRCDRYKSDSPILVFSDPHCPFDHPNFPYFLQDTAKKYKVGQVICLGDLIDNHAISRHGAEPCALGAYSELDLAIQRLKIYSALFPDVDYVVGNHDERINRQAASVGIGSRFIKDLHEVLELPDGWVCRGAEFIQDNVLYSHGVNWGGKNGAINKAHAERMSVAIGHSHSFGGVQYSANSRDTVFGINVGCGVNREAYAFAYGKYSKQKETLGCGIVFNNQSAIFIPMGKEFL